MRYHGTYVTTLTDDDVGQSIIHRENDPCAVCKRGHRRRTFYLSDVLGYVQAQDVGKQLWQARDGVLFVENNEQMAARLAEYGGIDHAL